MDLRSPLGKVKGLGVAKNGSHHWWMQRLTAVALIPLVIWFVLLVLCAVMKEGSIITYLSRPFSAVAMILFLGVSLYHGYLGMKVIIEDYVHCGCGRLVLVVFLNFITVVTAVASILAVAYLHIGSGRAYHKYHKFFEYHENEKQQGDPVDKVDYNKWKEEFYERLKGEQAKAGK